MGKRIVCFGEVLIRLAAPGAELLLQSPRLDLCVGGAEANVAVSLARFGHAAAVVTTLPDNPLGQAAAAELGRYGVDVSGIGFSPGRMGLYFLAAGAGVRPSEVTYDRAGSAFAEAAADTIDWDEALKGADWLHLSGVTPAVGLKAAEAAVRAARAARDRGLTVSFDGNYRAKLWDAWQGDAPAILKEIVACADILFADHRDIGLILDGDYAIKGAEQRRRLAADAAFAAFPQLQRMASTVRVQHSVDNHDLAAMMFSKDASWTTASQPLARIVDRIGAGDAFAAGVIHGMVSGMDEQATLEFGLAAACLKHSIPGDFNLASEAQVRALVDAAPLDVKR
jgi:2-dehydro-3-deoxygluconokinase